MDRIYPEGRRNYTWAACCGECWGHNFIHNIKVDSKTSAFVCSE